MSHWPFCWIWKLLRNALCTVLFLFTKKLKLFEERFCCFRRNPCRYIWLWLGCCGFNEYWELIELSCPAESSFLSVSSCSSLIRKQKVFSLSIHWTAHEAPQLLFLVNPKNTDCVDFLVGFFSLFDHLFQSYATDPLDSCCFIDLSFWVDRWFIGNGGDDIHGMDTAVASTWMQRPTAGDKPMQKSDDVATRLSNNESLLLIHRHRRNPAV